jgi:hypothetical protein
MTPPAARASAPSLRDGTLRWGLLCLIYVIVSALVLNTFMERWELMTDSQGNGFIGYVNRTANRPWIYRVLTPALVNAAFEAIPPQARRALDPLVMERSHLLKFPRIRNTPAWTPDIAIKYHLTYFFLFACLVAALFAYRYLTGALFAPAAVFQDFAPALGLLLLPLTFLHGGYLYDFPELMFMGLALVCIVQRKWLLYYPVLLLAILNKEADVLLILFFVAAMVRSMPRGRFLAHVAAQGALGIAVLVAVRQAYAGHVGSAMQFHLDTNLRYLAVPQNYLRVFDVYAPLIPVPRGFNILTLLFLAALVGYRWREKPPFLKRLFVLTTSAAVPLFLWGGFKDELRNLSLMFPAIYLLGFHALHDVYARARPAGTSLGTGSGGQPRGVALHDQDRPGPESNAL